jgi:hypothetical protein
VDDSDIMLVVARDAESGGFTLLALPLPCDRLQLQPVRVIAPVPERQWSVFFDDAELPADALIGQGGQGGRALFDGLNPERLIVAAQAVGLGRWCLARASEYARERVGFDVPIGQHQAVQHPLAEALPRRLSCSTGSATSGCSGQYQWRGNWRSTRSRSRACGCHAHIN